MNPTDIRKNKVSRLNAHSPVEHRFGEYGGQYVPETLMPALIADSPSDGPIVFSYSRRGFICRLPDRMTVR